MSKVVGVEIDGVTEWHIPGCGVSDYCTLCGIDGNDPKIGQTGVVRPPPGTKINCPQCTAIWSGLTQLRLSRRDFSMRPNA